jgi:hypothetical protein
MPRAVDADVGTPSRMPLVPGDGSPSTPKSSSPGTADEELVRAYRGRQSQKNMLLGQNQFDMSDYEHRQSEEQPSFLQAIVNTPWFKVLAYILIGIAFGNWVGWTVLDSAYFSVVTATTVGYGDFSLIDLSMTSRLFGCLYMFTGVIVMGDILGSAADALVEQSNERSSSIEHVDDFVNESDEERNLKYFYKKFRAIVSLLIVILVGASFYSYNEGLAFDISFYLMLQTVTTVGYGDITLESETSRLFSIFYIPFSVWMVAVAIGEFTQVNLDKRADKKRAELLSLKVTPELIRRMDNDGDRSGDVSEAEYLVWMLVEEGLVNRRDCERHLQHFNVLDESDDKVHAIIHTYTPRTGTYTNTHLYTTHSSSPSRTSSRSLSGSVNFRKLRLDCARTRPITHPLEPLVLEPLVHRK